MMYVCQLICPLLVSSHERDGADGKKMGDLRKLIFHTQSLRPRVHSCQRKGAGLGAWSLGAWSLNKRAPSDRLECFGHFGLSYISSILDHRVTVNWYDTSSR